VENERLLTDEELNNFLTPRTQGINETIKAVLNIKRNIAKAQDAKSYAIGKQEGRTEAAREILKILKDWQIQDDRPMTNHFKDTYPDYIPRTGIWVYLKSHFGVTE
jgi:hypothetical protein